MSRSAGHRAAGRVTGAGPTGDGRVSVGVAGVTIATLGGQLRWWSGTSPVVGDLCIPMGLQYLRWTNHQHEHTLAICCDAPHHVLTRLETERRGAPLVLRMDLAGSWALEGSIQPIYRPLAVRSASVRLSKPSATPMPSGGPDGPNLGVSIGRSRGLSLDGVASCIPTLPSGCTILRWTRSWTCLGKRLLGNSLSVCYPILKSPECGIEWRESGRVALPPGRGSRVTHQAVFVQPVPCPPLT